MVLPAAFSRNQGRVVGCCGLWRHGGVSCEATPPAWRPRRTPSAVLGCSGNTWRAARASAPPVCVRACVRPAAATCGTRRAWPWRPSGPAPPRPKSSRRRPRRFSSSSSRWKWARAASPVSKRRSSPATTCASQGTSSSPWRRAPWPTPSAPRRSGFWRWAWPPR